LSQIYKASTGGGGSGITTIDGNSGSITGTTVSIETGGATGTALFTNSGTGSNLTFGDANGNINLGTTVLGVFGATTNNTGYGNNGFSNLSSGIDNTCVGNNSSNNISSGSFNSSFGNQAGTNNVLGSYNCFFGYLAGSQFGGASTDSSNIAINAIGVNTVSNSLTIGSGTGTGNQQLNSAVICGIQGIAVTGAAVLVSASDQLGVTVSSAKYKENILPMGEASKAIFDLQPSIFNYKHDPDKQTKFGLIAEEVEKVLPQLVIYDSKGEPQSVAYHDLPVLLLREIQRLRIEVDALKAK